MRGPLLHVALLISISLNAWPAAGQQPPTTIPTDLALALLDHGGGISGERSPKIVVGKAPDPIPASLTSLEGAVVAGGLEYPQTAIVVLAFTLPPNQVMLTVDKQLTARGWKPPPPPPTESSGFSAGYSFMGGNAYCADSAAATVSYSPAPKGGTYLKVQYFRNKERSVCATRTEFGFRQRLFKFPALLPPSGMIQGRGGSGSDGDNAETSAHLRGVLAPPVIVAHYVKQLDSAGWKLGATVTSGAAAISSAEVKDSDGVLWLGAITAWRVGADEIEVAIRMSRPSDR